MVRLHAGCSFGYAGLRSLSEHDLQEQDRRHLYVLRKPRLHRFVQQLQQFGFTPNIPVVTTARSLKRVLPEQNDAQECERDRLATLDNPENKAFMKLWAGSTAPGLRTRSRLNMAMVLVAVSRALTAMWKTGAFLKALQAVRSIRRLAPSPSMTGVRIMDQYSYEVVNSTMGLWAKVAWRRGSSQPGLDTAGQLGD